MYINSLSSKIYEKWNIKLREETNYAYISIFVVAFYTAVLYAN